MRINEKIKDKKFQFNNNRAVAKILPQASRRSQIFLLTNREGIRTKTIAKHDEKQIEALNFSESSDKEQPLINKSSQREY